MSKPKIPAEQKNYRGLFVCLSLALLVSTIWLVFDEFETRRPWKEHQRRFFELETGLVDAKITEERERLEAPKLKQTLADLQAGIDKARAALEGGQGQQAKHAYENAKTEYDRAMQESAFARSEFDAVYYVMRKEQHRRGQPEKYLTDVERWAAVVAEKEADVAHKLDIVKQTKAPYDDFRNQVDSLEQEREALLAELTRLIEQREYVSSRYTEISQVVLPGLNTVDRCQSCHMAIDRAGFEASDIPNPFRTHPERDKLLGKVHPVKEFGCTCCHHGQGPQLKGIGSSPFNHARSDHYWKKPLLEKPFTESTCPDCHKYEWQIEQAPTLGRGIQSFTDLGCYGCHSTPGFATEPDTGPSLTRLKSKVEPDWLPAWIANPVALRPATRMPEFWPDTLDENGKPRLGSSELLRRDQEVSAICAALLADTDPQMAVPIDGYSIGDHGAGSRVFVDVGCVGCHRPAALDLQPLQSRSIARDYGPELSYVGSKFGAEWIISFTENPYKYWEQSRMPDLRLSRAESSGLAAFLVGLKRESPFPKTAALSKIELIESGRERIRYYGCAGCHEIPGFENEGKVGVELDQFGAKPPVMLDYGDYITDPKAQTWKSWILTKLQLPRVFKLERIDLKMPDYGLNETEAQDQAVYLKSLTGEHVNPNYVRRLDQAGLALVEGERLIARGNCRGCHLIDQLGGDVRVLMANPGLYPPDLSGEGEKVQPAWLFQFFKQPTTLRPWMSMRMPTFNLSDDETNILISYFMAHSDVSDLFVAVTTEMEPETLETAKYLFEQFKCLQCHQLTVGENLTLSDLAPDMGLTKTRLRPDWMESFIRDPQMIQPGTKMPTYFPLEDDDYPDSITTPLAGVLNGDPFAQIKALTDYLYVLE